MINNDIPEQGFERIRNAIACVLMSEFKDKAARYRNEALKNVKFFAERNTPIAATETSIIIISLWKGKYDNKDIDYVDGTYKFVIDIITNSGKKGDLPADAKAGYRMHKILGAVRYILEHSIYRTLGFDPPFIMHTELSEFQVLKFDDVGVDSNATTQAQAIFSVRCGEYTDPVAGVVISNNTTTVKLEDTELGYEYDFETQIP